MITHSASCGRDSKRVSHFGPSTSSSVPTTQRTAMHTFLCIRSQPLTSRCSEDVDTVRTTTTPSFRDALGTLHMHVDPPLRENDLRAVSCWVQDQSLA